MDYKEVFELILDENNFTVGGGSTSAIVGAMACGLIGMVVNLSKGKDYGYTDEKYQDILKKLEIYKEEFKKSSVEDTQAYQMIVAAYKLPKESQEEKDLRKKAISQAGIQAAMVPLANAKRNKILNEIGKELIENSNHACITDLEAGIDLSQVGINAGKANVYANISLIKDEKILEELKKELEEI